MQSYYAAFPDYPHTHAPSLLPLKWRQLLADVRRRSINKGWEEPLAILEFGFGRTGFPAWSRQQLGSDVTAPLSITCQDMRVLIKLSPGGRRMRPAFWQF